MGAWIWEKLGEKVEYDLKKLYETLRTKNFEIH